MTDPKALEIAAQCWCDPRVSDRVMDPELATVFAEKLEATLSSLAAMTERAEAAESVCREVQGMSQWGDIIAREATGQTNWNVLVGKLEAWRSTQGKGST